VGTNPRGRGRTRRSSGVPWRDPLPRTPGRLHPGRSSAAWSSAPRISPRAGRGRAMRCSPASVGVTLRVVLARRRTPTRSCLANSFS